MLRVWHGYTTWEDYQAGMYAAADKLEHQELSAALLKSPDHLRGAMAAAVAAWPIAAEHNLTDTSSNRRAWLGQAACCYEHGAPQDATCAAWWTLSDAQRDAANAQADTIIRGWEQERTSAQALFRD